MRSRVRELGIRIGVLPTGPANAITDVPGVRVGHSTIIHDDPCIARTGVTAIIPAENVWSDWLAAGFHRFNGGGEMTGVQWIEEAGMLTSPICLTSTWSLGIVRDTLLRYAQLLKGYPDRILRPVVAETNDSALNDGFHQPVLPHHVIAALEAAQAGPVAEGGVGGGTGMMCFEFKGGIGTASRRIGTDVGDYTVGVLVQANFGARSELVVAGAPVGRHIGYDRIPSPKPRNPPAGSIIIIVATDAPLMPVQCERLARRAVLGLGRVGGVGHNLSGDLILAFSTGNRFPAPPEMALLLGSGEARQEENMFEDMHFLAHRQLNPLFQGVAEATEEAILNAMTCASTMSGAEGRTVHELPLDLLSELVIHSAGAGEA